MSNPWEESVDDDVLYPDDLAGETFELVGDAPVEAEEVDHENAQYGWFMEVSNGESEKWASCPVELRKELGVAGAEKGHVFRVDGVDEGREEHDPYQFEVVHEPDRS